MEGTFDRNFWINVIEGALNSGGIALFSLQVILPSWLAQLGAGPFLIGLLPFVWFMGFALPQAWSAERVQPLAFRKPYLVRGGLFMRLPWVLLPAAVWLLRDRPDGLIAATFVCTGVFVVGMGTMNPVWVQFIGKLTPPNHRARLHGFRMLFGGGLALVTSWIGGRLLTAFPFPLNYAAVFAVAAAFLMAGWGTFNQLEETVPAQTGPREGVAGWMGRVALDLWETPRLRTFLTAALAAQTAVWMPATFFTAYGLHARLFAPDHIGTMAVVLATAQAGWSALFGWWGDRAGNRPLFLASMACAFLAAASALAAAWWPWGLTAAIAWSGGAISGTLIAVNNLMLEYAPPGEEAKYVSVMTKVLAGGAAVSPFAGGWLASHLGYPSVFWATAGASAAALWFASRLPKIVPS